MSQKPAETEIVHLAEEWNAAELRGDTAYLERVLSDDFAAVGPLGFVLTREQWIGRHQVGDLKYRSLDLTELAARVYDAAAVLIGRLSQEATYQGNSVNAQLRTTVLLIRRGGQWQIAGVHMSPIGQPPAFAQQRGSGS